ncbi:MAG: hypothetical protein M3N31_09520 [Actinomycetota bacterium]|nr:hypothetical protein [Actinomycetota bacterium]
MSMKPTVLPEGGFSVLEASLIETLARLTNREVVELLAAGFTADDLVRVVATMPPFGEVLTERVQQHLRRHGGRS